MLVKIKKIIFPLLTIVFVALVLNDYWADFAARDFVDIGDGKLVVRFLDVGQGDGIYIRTPEAQDILIDGGPDGRILGNLGKVMPFGDDEIDAIILTHPHADHIVGLVEVLKRYKVGAVYYTGVSHTSGAFFEFLNLIKEKNIPMHIVSSGDQVPLSSDISLDILWPTPPKELVGWQAVDLNDSSIVARLVFGETEFLFMGDAGADVEASLLKSGRNLSADVIKIGHHGSKTASSQEFLDIVSPTVAVISCGKNNDFNFPTLLILNRLKRLGVQTFRTDLNGEVVAISDGAALKFEKSQ